MASINSRKELLERKRMKQAAAQKAPPRPIHPDDETYRMLCTNLAAGRLIPIIGDTVRNEHIFNVDFSSYALDEEEEDGETATSPETQEKGDGSAENALNITERMTAEWAEKIGYPMTDSTQMARVAQFHCIQKRPYDAKSDYLTFQKQYLLDLARDIAELEDNMEMLAKIALFERQRDRLSFADIVAALEFPRFPDDMEDPLEILASMPISIYITTGYYDFLERALEKAGRKNYRSNLSLWKVSSTTVDKKHLLDPEWRPTPDEPLVYHAFGLERYPESMVLREDDYLDFLVRLVRGDAQEKGKETPWITPSFLPDAIQFSSLLLLGYRIEDWDFRILFRGLLATDLQSRAEGVSSLAIQLDTKEQKVIKDVEKASKYLSAYFNQANFQVLWSNTDKFIRTFKEKWDAFNSLGVIPGPDPGPDLGPDPESSEQASAPQNG